jgi:hypothetical protein
MSQVEFHVPVKSIHGKLEKKARIIMRQKKFRAPTGAVLHEGVQESYAIVHPRDFDKTPAKGAEKANMRTFGDVSLKSSEIIRSERYTDEELAAMTPEQRTKTLELRAQLEDFRRRFYAQFKRPDHEAPFEKKPQPGSTKLMRKQYVKLDNFIQAIIRERLKNH